MKTEDSKDRFASKKTYLNKYWRLSGINIEPRSQILLARASDDFQNV